MRAGLLLGAMALALAAFAHPARAACNTSDHSVICGLVNPEDMIQLPGTPWIVATHHNLVPPYVPPDEDQFGPLSAINIETHKHHQLYPSPDSTVALDHATYPDCSTPPEKMSSHGLNLRPLGRGKFRLYVVNHISRESVEIIDVQSTAKGLKTTWRGCALAPEGIQPNAVSPMPGGGFVLAGGGIAIWEPHKGWTKVWKQQGNNGVEASSDGKWLYINDIADRMVTKMDASTGTIVKSTAKFDFNPDNIRWGDDGSLYAAGPWPLSDAEMMGCFKKKICDIGTVVVKIDPATLTPVEVYRAPGIKDEFGAATIGLPVGKTFWLGGFLGDRVMIVPRKD